MKKRKNSAIIFKSKEEEYFSWYLEELLEAEFIKDWKYENIKFELSPNLKYRYKEIKVSKVRKIRTEKTKTIILLNKASYTPDFNIKWAEKAKGIFYGYNNNHNIKDFPFVSIKDNTSIIEIKPLREKYNMKRLALQNIKWVYDKYGVYIQIIVPINIFKTTFTPKRFLLTDKSFIQRKLHYNPVTLNEFLKK